MKYGIAARTTGIRSALGRRLRFLAVLALVVPATACSIGAEDSSRTWSSWDRFEEPPQSSASGVDRIYLLTSQFQQSDADPTSVLTTVKRDIERGVNSYRAILDVLFKGPTSDEAVQGLKSSIPIGLTVMGDPRFEQGTVLVNLSKELTTAFGDNLVDALAQIVWTLCERPETRQVRILVDGRSQSWPRADGTLLDRPLTPFDFPGFAISTQPDFPGILDTSISG